MQRLVPSTSSVSRVYRSPADSALYACVNNHVVYDRVIFPGTGYLELARAAASAERRMGSVAAIRRVHFLQPLAVVLSDGQQIDCIVAADRFEVSSALSSHTDATVHLSLIHI